MTASHLQEIKKGILDYFFLINALKKHKREMRRMIQNPMGNKLRQFTERLQEINNLLPKFPGSDESGKITQE